MQSVVLRSCLLARRVGMVVTQQHPIRHDLRLHCVAEQPSRLADFAFFRTNVNQQIPRLPKLPIFGVQGGRGASGASSGSVRTPAVGSGPSAAPVPPAGGNGGAGSSGSGGSSGGGGEGSGGGGLGGLWAGYLRALESNPILTKSLSAAVLNGIGDLIAQLVVEKKDKVDFHRLGIFTLLGFIVIGPCLHFWYGLNNRLVPAVGTKPALIRLALDQLLWAPVFVAGIFASLFVLEGHPEDIRSKLEQDWVEAVKANWKLWVPFQFINFRFVPPSQQVLFANMVALIWNTYISVIGHRKSDAA